MKAKLFITLFAIVALFGVQTVSAEMPPEPAAGTLTFINGFTLNEYADLAGVSGLYSHSVEWSDVNLPPMGPSVQSAGCPGERLILGQTGTPTLGGDKMSWTFWVWADASMALNNHAYIYAAANNNSLFDAAGEFGFWREDTTANFHFTLIGDSNTVDVALDPIPNDTWVHYAIAFDAGRVRAYVDGVRVYDEAVDVPTVPECSGREGTFAAAPYSGIAWKGYIDDWGWFDGAIVSSQVLDIMANGIESLAPITDCKDPGGVVLWSDFNEDCYVDILDFVMWAADWLKCTDPTDSACDEYWQ